MPMTNLQPQRQRATWAHLAAEASVRFPPIPDISVVAAFDPKLQLAFNRSALLRPINGGTFMYDFRDGQEVIADGQVYDLSVSKPYG